MAFDVENWKQKESLRPFIKAFSPGEMLFFQGESGNTLFLILKGKVSLLLETESGEHVFAVVSPGELLGEKALLNEPQHQRVFSAQAMDSVMAIQLRYQDLVNLQKTEPALILDILYRSFAVSAKRLEQANLLARVLKGSNIRKRFFDCIVYLSHSSGSKTNQGVLIPTLKEALNYHLDLSEKQRDLFIDELVKEKILEEATEGAFCLKNEEKLLTLSQAK